MEKNVTCVYFNGFLTICFANEEGMTDITVKNATTGNMISETFDSADIFNLYIGCEEGCYEILFETSIEKRYSGYLRIVK